MVTKNSITLNEALDAGFIGDDCYVTYDIVRPDGSRCGQAQFHYDTTTCGFYAGQLFRNEDGSIKTVILGEDGVNAVLVKSANPLK